MQLGKNPARGGGGGADFKLPITNWRHNHRVACMHIAYGGQQIVAASKDSVWQSSITVEAGND